MTSSAHGDPPTLFGDDRHCVVLCMGLPGTKFLVTGTAQDLERQSTLRNTSTTSSLLRIFSLAARAVPGLPVALLLLPDVRPTNSSAGSSVLALPTASQLWMHSDSGPRFRTAQAQ